MGVFTCHKRSATIVAKEECAGLAMQRNLMMQVTDGDKDMKSIILENVVRELSTRLAQANVRLDELSRTQEQAAPAAPEEETPPEVDESAEPETPEAEAGGDDEEMPAAEDIA
jgi:hypothetical protein